jgi:hypothetical protein
MRSGNQTPMSGMRVIRKKKIEVVPMRTGYLARPIDMGLAQIDLEMRRPALNTRSVIGRPSRRQTSGTA